MISADGWFDWMDRMEGTPSKRNTNPGVNGVKGVFLHSAEGYAPYLLDLAVSGPLSWHVSSLLDGRIFQHHSLLDRCWHATTANDEYVGVENEGIHTVEASLNDAQISNAVRMIADLAAWKGWMPTRTGDKTQTLWEHREVVWLGGSATACPSGRIPWETILAALNPPQPDRRFIAGDHDGGIEVAGHQLIFWNDGRAVIAIGDYEGTAPGQFAKLFGPDWNWLRRGANLLEGSTELAAAVWSEDKGD